MDNQRGFALVEVLVVFSILLLVAAAVHNSSFSSKCKFDSTDFYIKESELNQLAVFTALHFHDHNTYPVGELITLTDINILNQIKDLLPNEQGLDVVKQGFKNIEISGDTFHHIDKFFIIDTVLPTVDYQNELKGYIFPRTTIQTCERKVLEGKKHDISLPNFPNMRPSFPVEYFKGTYIGGSS